MKTAFVTGGNKGIGFFIAQGLLAHGFQVILGCRSTALAAQAADKLAAANPTAPAVRFVELDIAQSAQISAAVAALSALAPEGLDVLVNNAGFAYRDDATEPFGQQASVTNGINFFGTMELTLALRPQLKAGARVINVGSRVGLFQRAREDLRAKLLDDALTLPELAAMIKQFVAAAADGKHQELGWPDTAYGTSKIGVQAMTRILSRDAAWRGIDVNVMCPGWCRTDMAGDEAPRSAEQGADTAVWMATEASLHGTTGKFYADRRELDYVTGPW